MVASPPAPPAELYVDGYTFDEYLAYLRQGHPELYALLSLERCLAAGRQIEKMNLSSWEFEDQVAGGRGSAYNFAQRTADNRKVGMTTLLKCFSPSRELPDQAVRILDVLGGDGTLARFCKTLGRPAPCIYTADISKYMIEACMAQALPCVRQSATRSLFKDNALEGVLIAYGSHHLDRQARPAAVREAYRTLQPGGRLVLHDFEIGGPGAQWFDRVVHPYSRTGHPHAHFSRSEMEQLLGGAGFCEIAVFDIDDPFTLQGDSPEAARRHAIMHMYGMYDLVKLAGSAGDIAPRLERHIAETLGPISVRPAAGRYEARIPRRALVAVGSKPAP